MRKQQSVYDEITDKLIAQLEKGVMPWLAPWSDKAAIKISGHGSSVPINRVSGRAYSGINTIMLWCSAIVRAATQASRAAEYLLAQKALPLPRSAALVPYTAPEMALAA